MGVGLGGSSIGYHGYLADKGLREDLAGENHRICSSEGNIRFFYRRRADEGLQ